MRAPLAARAVAPLSLALAASAGCAGSAPPIRTHLTMFEGTPDGQRRFCTSAGSNDGVEVGMTAHLVTDDGRLRGGTIDRVTERRSCALTHVERAILTMAPDVEIVP